MYNKYWKNHMSLKQDDLRHLTAAEGYLELGMALEANEELDQIDLQGWHDPEVLKLRLDVSRHLHSWELMKIAASNLAQVDPADPQWTMSLAYATRRVESGWTRQKRFFLTPKNGTPESLSFTSTSPATKPRGGT